MASEELLLFNDQFPNSKYREIHPQFIGDINNENDRKKYQNSKAPINANILSFKDIKNTENRIGWIVPKEYIVIDIDNKTNARYIFDILQNLNIKFSFMTGKKGGHFIFKNKRGIQSISAGQACSIGFTVDVRCNEKGYIILPENDTDRKWGTISNDIDDVPFFLIPQRELKIQTNFIGMKDGDGRNDALHKHMLALIDYAKDLTLEEKCESIRIINKYLFSGSMTELELQKTVLREEILKKQEDSDKDDRGCYEEKLASRIIKDKQIITCNDVCYMFTGKYYKKITDLMELERVIHLEYNERLKDKQRKEILKFIKLKSWIPAYELNKNWNEIVFRNGVLNLASMKLTPHSPYEYNTIYIDCNYIPDAPYSEAIDSFFNQISAKEMDKKTLLYEMIGYCLIRKNVFSKFFICYGEGQTGKSTYLKLIGKLVGKSNTSFLSLNDLESQFKPAELFGKLVNLGDDIPYKGLKETDVLKKLVTGETFAAEQKYVQAPLNFSNFAKLIFTTNKLPEVYDRTSGFYRRFMIIDINNKIEKPDPFFMERLTDADYEYLLSVAIEKVVQALNRNALTECASSMMKLQQYKTEQSSVLSFLEEFNLDRVKLDHRPCMEIYTQYEQYCRDTGFKALKKINFDKEVCEEFKMQKKNTINSKKDDKNQCWRFVCLRL